MKMIVAVPVALLTFGVLLGCSQHASTAPAVDRPAATAAASQTNTFGESKEEAAGSAASARAANYGTEPAPAADATPPPPSLRIPRRRNEIVGGLLRGYQSKYSSGQRGDGWPTPRSRFTLRAISSDCRYEHDYS